MNSATAAANEVVRLPWFPSLRALTAMFVLALRQQFHGWRLVILSLLYLLPAALLVVIRLTSPMMHQKEIIEFSLLYVLIPHALAPLTALLCSAGIVRDELEEQTLTYLLLRTVPRPAIYALKLLAALLAATLLTAFFTSFTLLLIAFLTHEPFDAALAWQAGKIVAVLTLAQVAYCGLFGLLGLLMRRSLLIGVAYILMFEGVLASFDTVARRITVMYYFRVLVLRWLNPSGSAGWVVDLKTAPGSRACVLILLGTGLVLTILGSLILAVREFRMKTPEGE